MKLFEAWLQLLTSMMETCWDPMKYCTHDIGHDDIWGLMAYTLRSMITLFWGIRGIHSEAMRKFFEHDLIHLRNSYFDLRMMEFIMEHDGNTCMHSGTAWSYFEARWHSQRFMMEMWRGIYWEAWFHSLRIMMEILWHTVPHTHKSEIFGAFTLVEF